MTSASPGANPGVLAKAARVRLLALDVDGVLTTGELTYTEAGEELKHFHVRDGLGIKLLQTAGIDVAVISARDSKPLARRMADLDIQHYFPLARDKRHTLSLLCQKLGITLEQVCFVGDDLVDLSALEAVGLAVGVQDAHPRVLAVADFVTDARGGQGAVREVVDLLLSASGRLDSVIAQHLESRAAAATPAAFGVIIPARYASSRLPGKPLLPLAGKPMIAHVCENAERAGAEFVTVATDDERIAQAVKSFGGQCVLTSLNHASGTDRLAETVEKLGVPDDAIIVNLQGDEPLVKSDLIRGVAQALAQRPQAGIATLATPVRDSAALFNPNVVKVVLDDEGFAEYFSRAPIPWVRDSFTDIDSGASPLPETVTFLRHLGIYAYRCGTLKRFAAAPSTAQERAESLEQLRALAMKIPIFVEVVSEAPGHGVDTSEDVLRVEAELGTHQPSEAGEQ